MNDKDIVARIIKRQQDMTAYRAPWESLWWAIDQKVLPSPNMWFGNKPREGGRWNQQNFDSTAGLALGKFAAAMESMLTPRNTQWHKLTTPPITRSIDVQRYLDMVNDILFKARYSPFANFASQMTEVYLSLGKFGTGALFVYDEVGKGIRYKSIHLSELFFVENAYGVVDTVHRKFQYTAHQAAEFFGVNKLPEKLVKALEANQHNKFDFIHVVEPNVEYDAYDKELANYPYRSYYICTVDNSLIDSSGYFSMPYLVTRYLTEANETYGRGPAGFVLPDIQTLNEQKKTAIRQGQLAVDPPLLLSEDGALSTFSIQAGALNFGALDSMGNPLIQPLKMGGDFRVCELMIDDSRKIINDSFLVTLFQILVDTPQMTATEAMLRAQEKGALLAPTMGRQQSELLGPLIQREIDILFRAGIIPPPPEEMVDEFEIQYQSELARNQKLGEANAIINTLQAVSGLAQYDQRVLEVFNPVEIARKLAEINGVPASCLYSDEELANIDNEKRQAEQMQQILAAAEPLADAGKTLVETQQLANQGGPATIAP